VKISQIRGAIFEEVVLHLLTLVGYRIVKANEEGTRQGHSGLEVRGRGEWHQIDALAAFDRTPAFMYPLRLMVEAKCYRRGNRVGIEVVRNSVGVLKDISENYFTPPSRGKDDVYGPRFNYLSAIASTSGFTKNAQRYAIAHQVFLIQYKDIPLFMPIRDGLLGFEEAHFRPEILNGRGDYDRLLRKRVRELIKNPNTVPQGQVEIFTEEGAIYFREAILQPLLDIKGSYYGALQGRWPVHLLSREDLPEQIFSGRDEVRCRIRRINGIWGFEPIEGKRSFRLEFSLPDQIARLIGEAEPDQEQIANIKEDCFSFVDITGKIGGILRNVRFSLDRTWMEAVRARFSREGLHR